MDTIKTDRPGLHTAASQSPWAWAWAAV